VGGTYRGSSAAARHATAGSATLLTTLICLWDVPPVFLHTPEVEKGENREDHQEELVQAWGLQLMTKAFQHMDST
jgi:hypothetical protein